MDIFFSILHYILQITEPTLVNFFFKIKTSINTSAMDMSQKLAEIDFFL